MKIQLRLRLNKDSNPAYGGLEPIGQDQGLLCDHADEGLHSDENLQQLAAPNSHGGDHLRYRTRAPCPRNLWSFMEC